MASTRIFVISLLFFIVVINVTGQTSEISQEEKWTQRMNELNALVPENIDIIRELAMEHLEDCPFEEIKKDAYYHSFMAEVYYYQQELSQSLNSYKAALANFQRGDDSTYLAVLYNNIGLIHYLKANFDSALVAYNHSLELEKRDGNKEGIAMSYQNLGIIYGKWERYDLVYEYYNNDYKEY